MSEPIAPVEYTKKELPAVFGRLGMVLAALGLTAMIIAYFVDHTRAAFNGLILLMFMTSVGAGSIFLIALEYVAGAIWSTPFRRVSEF